ncbi:MAG: DmsE family decaheme c-type cytochrome [Proteobacteria bacterium]|nr:DmsE family decaheme c-type cytochrome [Pseudomonadota bacterium]
MRRATPRRLSGLLILTILTSATACSPAAHAPQSSSSELPALDGAEFVGHAVCVACHTVESSHWETTIHARRFLHAPRTPLEARACESCHGPGSLHVAAPSDPGRIVSFTRESATPTAGMNAMCLQCHVGGERLHWHGSEHEAQGLACSDCHNPMAAQSPSGLLARESVNETCFQCHAEQRAALRLRGHMPIDEGSLDCADCHNPHGATSDALLRADDVNALCFECHADKRGPFLWDHAPVVESCLNCHRPHGSPHPNLLVSRPPFLCQQCHAQPGGFGHPNDLMVRGNLFGGVSPDERATNRSCLNCHGQIHGSNHPSGARFHR